MKTRLLYALPLAAILALPTVAQQQSSTSDQSQATQTQNVPTTNQSQAQSDQQAKTNADLSAHQPLQPETRQGFWGKLNPFARKKYVQRQLSPIRNRVNELDELTASNTKALRDVDSRATEGIRKANEQALLADQHATDAGNRAQQANQTAQQATTHLQNVEQVVGNLDQYQQSNQVEIRFRPGATALSKNAKSALDDIAQSLKDQRGYIVEVQGFAPGKGQAAIAQSQHQADAVVRYLVLEHQIPVYRVYELGLGNAKIQNASQQTDQTGNQKPTNSRTPRVEVTLLKNGIEQLGTQQASASGAQSSSQPNSMAAPAQNAQPSSAPAYSQPANQGQNTNQNPK